MVHVFFSNKINIQKILSRKISNADDRYLFKSCYEHNGLAPQHQPCLGFVLDSPKGQCKSNVYRQHFTNTVCTRGVELLCGAHLTYRMERLRWTY
ncbi:hypothetical protein CEXT_449791 [Caerostris extrusa]|uniref:Uncharacterized protein n=1 Tax=Caerostris extrusa TaxID=172846 RepID=A0AAV4SSW4_CAEEX|nr:hypothetical protein CEXT_449791 [Caerostris extrusa]